MLLNNTAFVVPGHCTLLDRFDWVLRIRTYMVQWYELLYPF